MIDRDRLEAIVAEAGRVAMGTWPGAGHSLQVWEKSPSNLVCSGDLAVDAFLRRELTALLPAAGWLSEETADSADRLHGGLVWLVDPIDGTRDYVGGRSGWAVSVALVSAARPLLGYLCAPARGEFWKGEAGQGSWRNGKQLRASTRAQLAGARVPARSLPREDADLTMVDQPNSVALRIAMVASDEADMVATLRQGFEWDIAAAALIAREAGAAVTDALGGPINYNKPEPHVFGVLATAPAIHPTALGRLAERARRLAATEPRTRSC